MKQEHACRMPDSIGSSFLASVCAAGDATRSTLVRV